MKLNDNIYVLKLKSAMHPGQFIYLTLISNKDKLLLIDTGFPGQIEEINIAIENEGFNLDNLNAVLLTHQDIDHVGTVAEIINKVSDVQVVSSKIEEKYINGKETPTKLANLERNLDSLPEQAKLLCEKMKKFYECNKVNIDITLNEGECVPGFEDLVVVDTKGHTPGHISLYEKKSKTLIAGDAFVVKDGSITYTEADLNFDDKIYLDSLKNLCNYDIDTVICYHGGIYDKNVNDEIKRLTYE